MEIRILKDQEREQYVHLLSVAFALPMTHPQMKRNAADAAKYTIWGVWEEDRLLSAAMVYFLTCNLDGTYCKLLGIGGVVTYPEARRKGTVRKLLDTVLHTYRQEGYLFSGLIPFDHAFYRKFGYESSYVTNYYEIPLPELAHLSKPDHVRMIHDPADTKDAEQVYRIFAAGLNQTIGRENEPMGFEQVFGGDTCQDCAYRYVMYNGNNEPEAYVAFTVDTAGAARVMDVKELAWTDRDAMWRAFGFLSGFYSHYQSARVMVPTNVRLEMLLPRPRMLQEHKRYNYMMRVLQVEEAVKCLRTPRFSGGFILQLHDGFLPENDGTYRFSWEAGGSVRCEKTASAADGTMEISAFLQVLMGVISMQEAALRPDVQIRSHLEDMELLFPLRPQYKCEGF